MQNAEYIPAHFRLSPRAQAKLTELTDTASKAAERIMAPALFWGEAYDEIKRENVVRGIAWGWYYRDEVPERLLQEVDGITLLFAVSPKQASNFSTKEIDYQDGRQFFFTS